MQDVPISKIFPEVFPEDLPGLPPTRQVEFHIDLVPVCTCSTGTCLLEDRPKVRLSPIEGSRGRHLEDSSELDMNYEFQVKPLVCTNAPLNKQEHEEHLKIILELLKKEELQSLDPAKSNSVKDWATPKTPTEISSFFRSCCAQIGLPEGCEDLSYTAMPSIKGFGRCVLMQRETVPQIEVIYPFQVPRKCIRRKDGDIGGTMKAARHLCSELQCSELQVEENSSELLAATLANFSLASELSTLYVCATNIVLQGLPKDIYKLINHNIEAKAIWDNVKMLLAGENINEYYVRFHKLVNDMRNIIMMMSNIQLNSKFVNNMSPEWDRFVIAVKLNKGLKEINHEQLYFAQGNGVAGNGAAQNRAGNPKRPQNSDYFKDKMLLMQVQENGAVLDEEELLFLADECDAFDSDVDDELTAHSIFMANLSLAGPSNLQTGPSNASILSEVHMLENAINHSVTNQDDHKIHNEVQQANVIDSTSVDMGNSNVIPYEQYLLINNTSNVPSCASSNLNDTCVLFDNDVYVPHDPIATELKIYKEQVAIYKQRAKFKLAEREQRLDDQMRAKKAQPALYDGEELLKPHHVSVIIPSSEEDLELAEIIRNKLHAKINESTNLEEQKVEVLKSKAPPLPVLPPGTMYPPNTPVHLKTYKKRITPTGITEGERGFEQTKRCYLTKVFPFFNLLKEHFDEVQKSMVTEVRVMKAIIENMEAEVDQNEIDLKSGEIKQKNLLITNENLIANCIAQDVFYTVTNSALNAYAFHDLSIAYNVAMNRVVDLESKNSKLLEKIQHDNHDVMVKNFSKLEVAHLNLQLKYQHLKEYIENIKSKTSKDVPEFDTFFESSNFSIES
ncbi:hypothetical protein Tco_0381664 [Tanacetum coccineum]